jgi:hypothetical protein
MSSAAATTAKVSCAKVCRSFSTLLVHTVFQYVGVSCVAGVQECLESIQGSCDRAFLAFEVSLSWPALLMFSLVFNLQRLFIVLFTQYLCNCHSLSEPPLILL